MAVARRANRLRLIRNHVKPRREKYFTSVFQKHMILSAHPASTRGAYRDRHGRWKRDAVDKRMFQRACAPTKASFRTAKPCGPDTPTLVSSLRAISLAMVANKPGTPVY
jgi:hypothetical protein